MRMKVNMSVISDYFKGNIYETNRFFQYPDFERMLINRDKINVAIRNIQKEKKTFYLKSEEEISLLSFYEKEYYYHTLIAYLVTKDVHIEIDLTSWFEKKKLSNINKIKLAVAQYRNDKIIDITFPEKEMKVIQRKINEDNKYSKEKIKIEKELKKIWR